MAKHTRRKVAHQAAEDVFSLLEELAANTWWSWHPRAVELFERLDPKRFHACDQNPVVTLRKLSAPRRNAIRRDSAYLAEVKRVLAEQRRDLRRKTWFEASPGKRAKGTIAYFCMEYAVHESLPFYAGGLGVLAGDHLKSASDLGIPLVAVGIYWRQGYTRQRIDAKGEQRDAFPNLAPENTPLVEVTARSGKPLHIKIPLEKRTLTARAWQMDVGRVPLYLLDTDLPGNAPADRKLTHVLYSGDRDTRIRQELLLGVGGWRLLRALGISVTCCHLNEGHAAFLSLERIAERMGEHGESFKTALTGVRNTSVFTTHTPVPAGNEEFDPKLAERYLAGYLKRLGISRDQLHDLARVRPGDLKENFGMTPLALRTSRYANGVAALHGQVARSMWKPMFPGSKVSAVPIGHVTNGIHLRTWLHRDMADIYDGLFGKDWDDAQDRAALWKRCAKINDGELWSLHQRFKDELIEFCRARLRASAAGLKAREVDRILDRDALTIGFARRFATYKRATLVFSDAARFAKILNNADRPVQILFAGKAHPADGEGKALIQQLVGFARQARFRCRVVFLEDYEMEVARHMVAGVDVWLNNPQRPREASGTSGMKPALHGGLNLSILDGWWPEGFNGRNGWAIGRAQNHDGTKAADQRDARELYSILERQVVPLYFKRNAKGLPTGWLARMKNAMMTIPPMFNSHRQVKEYFKRYYQPAMRKRAGGA